MKPRTKFLIGGAIVLGTAGYLMASSIRSTGVYYLTPTELSAKLKADPTFTECWREGRRARRPRLDAARPRAERSTRSA